MSSKIGELYKYTNGLPSNPDVCNYPFVLCPDASGRTKDSARQQENGMLKMPRLSFLIPKIEFQKKSTSFEAGAFDINKVKIIFSFLLLDLLLQLLQLLEQLSLQHVKFLLVQQLCCLGEAIYSCLKLI